MDRIARYGGLKNRSRDMSAYIKSMRKPYRKDLDKLYSSISTCADYLVFHDYYTIDETRLVGAETCKKHLLCAFCAARRAAKATQNNVHKVTSVLDSRTDLIPVMITFTVKNGDDLSERFLHLKSAFQRLQQNRRNAAKGQKWTEFSRVQGAMFSYEITNIGQGWHPHIHMVALLDSYIDQKALSEEWKEITGDSFIVDIRRINSVENDAGTLDIVGAILEVFKYSMKFQDLSLELNFEAYKILSKKRMYGSFGNLRGIEIPKNLLDEKFEGLPYMERIYQYSPSKKAYDVTKVNSFSSSQCEQREHEAD